MNILQGQIRPLFFYAPPNDDGGAGDQEPKLGGKETVHVSEGAKKFGQRFAAPPEMRAKAGLPPMEDKGDDGEHHEDDPPKGEVKDDKSSRQREEHRKPGSNVPKIIEDKRRAEQALEESKKTLEKYEKETVPSLNQRIADLETKINSGNLTAAKEQELLGKIAEIERQKADGEEKLRGELETTRKKLSIYSITDDPYYKETYLRPLGEAIESLKGIVGNNPQVTGALGRAMMAQKEALQAASLEERAEIEKTRDEIIEGILEGMSNVSQRRFNASFDKYLEASEAQALALADHEKTALEARKHTEQATKQAVAQTMQEWTREYDAQAKGFDEDVKVGGEIEEKIKELGIGINLDEENKFAKAAIEGRLKRPQVVELIHRGRVMPILRAKVKALEALVNERQQTIDKLTEAGPGGAGKTGGRTNTTGKSDDGKPTNSQGETRADWQKKRFSMPTA